MHRRCFIVRYADDFIIGFESEQDAHRVMAVLPKRFARFGLSIHPDKTKLVRFGKPRVDSHSKSNEKFDFLGFTHFWSKSLRGNWVIKRKTMGKRIRRFVKAMWQWCRLNRHQPVDGQHRELCVKLRGYYQYYGVRYNSRALNDVLYHVKRAWQYWLSRRCDKGKVR